ncbi:hypothetical protein ABEB36_000874 [Hypothenemus hampei]|uniref:Peptidase M12B domain-containing protein n=1 Tax=Hypothenemus hampei TaxID=57062 RepID=A0ABD1FFY4_HYPHA
MLFEIHLSILVLSINQVLASSHCIDGKYHKGIKNFNLIIPRRIHENGEFKSFQLNEYFEHQIQKRSLNEPTTLHYGIWIDDDLQQLDLQPNYDFLHPNLVFDHRNGEPLHKREARNLNDVKLCYYTGKVHGFDDSSAAISTCDGLLGHVRIEDSNYFIEPIKGHEANEKGQHLHAIYDLNKKLFRKTRKVSSSWCGVDDTNWEDNIVERIRNSLEFEKKKFRRRETDNNTTLKPKYMETTIVCDKSFVDFHKGHRDLDVYLLTTANTAFNAFRDASFGSELTLSLVRVIYLDKDEPEMDLNVSKSIEHTLMSFNKFAQKINFPENQPWHHDVAILVSRVDMCNGSELKECVVSGTAKIGGACTANSSATVVEDDGVYELAMTMTHEIGHLLGITHDGEEGLGKSCCPPRKTYNGTQRSNIWIMSVVDVDATFLGWSQCSRAMSRAFIKNGWADCMNDQPEITNKKFNHIPIGGLYTRDEQCFLATVRKGNEFVSKKSCGDPSECENLYCEIAKNCKTFNHLVADGSSCGEDKWCWKSKCVPRGQRPGAVDGGWSDWSGWSECSRTCGGGIQINKRSCNNPQQQNGGRYCDGDDQMIKLCNLEPCLVGIRDKICKGGFSGVALFLRENPCQVPCINTKGNILWSNETVPDGEACSWGRHPKRRCILGQCLKVGCDDEIESTSVFDDCGVCNGDADSCTIVQGRWRQKKSNGPRTQLVTTFPIGAFNIKIKEATTSSSKISILNAETRKVYINNYESDHENATNEGPQKLEDGEMGYLAVDGLTENFTIEGPIKENLLFKVR